MGATSAPASPGHLRRLLVLRGRPHAGDHGPFGDGHEARRQELVAARQQGPERRVLGAGGAIPVDQKRFPGAQAAIQPIPVGPNENALAIGVAALPPL